MQNAAAIFLYHLYGKNLACIFFKYLLFSCAFLGTIHICLVLTFKVLYRHLQYEFSWQLSCSETIPPSASDFRTQAGGNGVRAVPMVAYSLAFSCS